MKHRTFLKRTVGVVAVVASLRALSGSQGCLAGQASEDNKGKEAIRVGIITQQDGPHLGIYLEAVRTSEGVARVAFCDRTGTEFKRAQRALSSAFREVPTYRSPSEMIKEFKPGIVIVALPAHLSPEPIQSALQAGCHVLAEKPACVRVEQFEKLEKLARSRNLHLMLALAGRMSARSLRARQIVQQGLLGKPYAATAISVKDQTRLTRASYQKSWFAFKEKAGGGHLIWLGIHQLDQILFLTGDRVERVAGFCRTVGGQPVEIEDAEALTMQFRSGMVGTFHGGYYLDSGAMQSGLTIWGSQGWLRLSAHRDSEGTKESFQWYSNHPEAPKGVQTETPTSKVDGYQALVQAAIDAARKKRPAPVTGDDSLQVLKVIFAAYRASETGTVQSVR